MKKNKTVMGMSVWKAEADKPHGCAEVHFTKGEPVDAAPIRCTCGWSGVVGEWHLHGERLQVSWGDWRPIDWAGNVHAYAWPDLEVAA